LNIVFYNKSYFTILDTDKTYNTPLAFVNCTILEESLSLLPVIYSIYEKSQNDKIFFYNTLNDYINGNNLKNYYWNINYSGELEKTGHTIKFNILSGTYMLEIIEEYRFHNFGGRNATEALNEIFGIGWMIRARVLFFQTIN
jgi:hypothetical protein